MTAAMHPLSDRGTWRCHICGRDRPDAQISVHRRVTVDPVLGRLQENVRYCNDSSDCAERSLTFSFMTGDIR